MQRSQRLKKIAKIGNGELADIERRMAQVHKELIAYEAQQKELLMARDEYASRLQAQANRRISGSEVRTLLAFLQRVDEALAQIEEQIGAKRTAHMEYQRTWITAKQRSRIMNEIVDRYTQAERNAQLQREQRESDDRPRPLLRD